MAVTIHSSPNLYTPSDNPIIWTFSSNQTAQANFSYIIEEYVNGTLTSRNEVFPEVGARSHFDMFETMCGTTPVPSAIQTVLERDAGNYLSCYIVIRERYGSTPAYQAQATASTVYAFKSALSNEKRQAWSYTAYLASATPGKFLTYNTNVLSIPVNGAYFLSIITNNIATLQVVIVLKNSAGSTTGSATVNLTAHRITQLNLSTALIVSDTPITQAQMDASDSVQIYIFDSFTDTNFSETKTYLIDRDTCGVPAHMIWLNKLSGFDCFNFKHNRIYSSQVQSKSYEKQFGEWQGTSFVLDAQNSGMLDYLKTATDKVQVVSDFITEAVQNYIVTSMYESPLCFMQIPADGITLARVNIEETGYELQQDEYTEEYSEIVELSFPNSRMSQRL